MHIVRFVIDPSHKVAIALVGWHGDFADIGEDMSKHSAGMVFCGFAYVSAGLFALDTRLTGIGGIWPT